MDQSTIDALQQAWLIEQATAHPPALQIGCGMKPIVGAVNTDPNPERARWADYQCYADNLPFEDASFGSVVSSHVINSLPDPGEAFREWARVLKPGGMCCHVIPDWRYAPDRKSSKYPFERQGFGWMGPEPFRTEIMAPLADVFQVIELANFTEFNWSFKLVAVRL